MRSSGGSTNAWIRLFAVRIRSSAGPASIVIGKKFFHSFMSHVAAQSFGLDARQVQEQQTIQRMAEAGIFVEAQQLSS